MPTIATLVIPISTAPSGSFVVPPQLDSHKVLIHVPVVWTDADIKVQVSNDLGVTWFDVMDNAGTVIIFTNVPTTDGGFQFAPDDAGGNDYIAALINAIPGSLMRVVSVNTAGGADLVQAAARTLQIISSVQAQTLFSRPSDTSAK